MARDRLSRTGEQSADSSHRSSTPDRLESAQTLDTSSAGPQGSTGPGVMDAVQRMAQLRGNRATERLLQRMAQDEPAAESETIAQRIEQQVGRGSKLPEHVQQKLSPVVGDTSHVQIHTGGKAQALSQDVNALAFTTGSDIFFGSGSYQPDSAEGLGLLAHEVTHTVQQAAGPVSGTPTAGGVSVSDPSDRFEQAAERAGQQMTQMVQRQQAHTEQPDSDRTQQTSRSGGTIQRQVAGGPAVVQRLMQTSAQVKSIAGEPKSNILFVKMSEHYKNVLAALDAYHLYLAATTLAATTLDAQKDQLHILLNTVTSTSQAYLAAHQDDHEEVRHKTISELVNSASEEKRSVSQVVRTAKTPGGAALIGQTWRAVIKDAQFGESGGLATPPGDATKIERDPGVEATLREDARIFPRPDLTGDPVVTAPRNQAVMRSDVKGFPAVVHVEVYKKEAKNAVVTASGYTRATSVNRSAVTHTVVGNNVPLFSGVPKMEDIQQGSIGDCYLMASMASIANVNPQMIYQMMRDNGDGSVTVRLYDIRAKPAPTPVYITVKKSLVDDGRRSNGAIWAPLLEKAYAVLGMGAGGNKVSQSYEQLGSGESTTTAFAILTGRAIGGGSVKSGDGPMELGSRFWTLPVILKYERQLKPRKAQGDLPEKDRTQYEYLDAYQMYQDDGLTDRFMDWVVSAKTTYIPRFQAAEKKGTIEKFTPILDDMDRENVLTAEMRRTLREALVAKYPGFRGSAVYTTFQVDLYDRIVTAVGAGRFIGAGTQGSVGKTDPGLGSAGEPLSRGIVGGHAYTVINVRTDGETGLRYIKVRNPWGNYGRQYTGRNEAGKLEMEKDYDKLKKASGTFELELSDFTKRFQNISFA